MTVARRESVAIAKAFPIHANALAPGHHEISQRVVDLEMTPLEEGPLVQLLASVEASPDVTGSL